MTKDYLLVCELVCVTEWVGEISLVCGIWYEKCCGGTYVACLYPYNCIIRHYNMVYLKFETRNIKYEYGLKYPYLSYTKTSEKLSKMKM